MVSFLLLGGMVPIVLNSLEVFPVLARDVVTEELVELSEEVVLLLSEEVTVLLLCNVVGASVVVDVVLVGLIAVLVPTWDKVVLAKDEGVVGVLVKYVEVKVDEVVLESKLFDVFTDDEVLFTVTGSVVGGVVVVVTVDVLL